MNQKYICLLQMTVVSVPALKQLKIIEFLQHSLFLINTKHSYISRVEGFSFPPVLQSQINCLYEILKGALETEKGIILSVGI